MDPRATELGSLGYFGPPSPPICWRKEEGSLEQACLRVAAMDRPLWDILDPVQFSLNNKTFFLSFSSSLQFP
jgi:hypothetical protein